MRLESRDPGVYLNAGKDPVERGKLKIWINMQVLRWQRENSGHSHKD